MNKYFLTGVIIILIIAGGWWYVVRLNTSGASRSAQTQTSTNEQSFAGNIDAGSLNTGSRTPTITGTYKGDAGVGVVIVKGAQTLPKNGTFSNLPNAVIVDYSDHGGDVNIDLPGSMSGKFSYTISSPLQAGTYTVGVYVYHNIYTDKEGYTGDSVPVLTASGILVVR